MELLIVNKVFAEENKGKTAIHDGANYIFDYRITKDGKYVCSMDYKITMPQLFENTTFETGNFETTDFNNEK